MTVQLRSAGPLATSAGPDASPAVPTSALIELRAAIRGEVLVAGDAAYDAARTVWNSAVDRHPAAVVRAAGVADVQTALAFARAHGRPFAVNGGGHSPDGLGIVEGGVTVDLAAFGTVAVDPAARVARVDGGVLGKQLGKAAAPHGLVAVGGKMPTTGVAGVTLGGGIGWLARRYGLVSDNLLAAELVLADGRHVRTDPIERPDLFWAIRGGGGNFGVVTALEFRLHALPQVYAGLLAYPIERAVEVLRRFRDFAAEMPDELGMVGLLLGTSPADSPLSGVAFCYAGDPRYGEIAVQPLVRALGEPLMTQVGATPYAAFAGQFEAMDPGGLRHAWRSRYLRSLSDAAIEALADGFARASGGRPDIAIERMGGAIADAPTPTAFAHRHNAYDLLVGSTWADPAADTAQAAWTEGVVTDRAVRAETDGGRYVNYLQAADEAAIRAAYGSSYERLAKVKAYYDPENVFRANQNIAPAS
jgi:FAD/FMN-containing dehydrogenase